MNIEPIAYIHTDFKSKFGIPRQSGRAPSLTGIIIPEPEYKNPEAFRGIEEFSHLWLIFGFSEAVRTGNTVTVRPPRLGGNKRVGVFASRSPFRPNSLGLSVVKFEKIEDGNIIVSGIDLLDNTPIYDIKPYLPYSDCIQNAAGSYGQENRGHFVQVVFPQNLLDKIPEDKQKALTECLGDDPRPSYQNDLRDYAMNFAGYDIHFNVKDGVLTVTDVVK